MSRSSLLLFVLVCCVGAAPVRAADPAWPLRHHDLRVALDPQSAGVMVEGSFVLDPAGDPGRRLAFLLHKGLEVEALRLGEIDLVVEALDRWKPRDFWRRPDFSELGPFATARHYRVDAPPGGWPEGELRLDIRYSGAVYDSLHAPEVAYARGFETTSGLVDPRGAFLSGETFWVPWTSEERFTFRLRTTLPDGWHSMSQGTREEHSVEAGNNVSVWVEESPQELIYLIAGPYTIRERDHDGVTLMTYTYENTDEELCATYLDAAARYLDLYGERFGPYPFTKWALVENWWQTGFGMPGFTLLGDRVIRLPFIVDTSYGHEILHCWWGNGVYVDYAAGNWCEGLTVHGADYLYKQMQSEEAARDYRRNSLVGYLDFASSGERDFALRDFRERSDFGTQAVGYSKSMMVFHMLETRLGEEVFLDGLRRFYRERRYQPSRWQDLAAAFGEAAGADLTAWFEQWVDRPGAVDLSLGAIERDEDGVAVEVVQSGPFYDAMVAVEWSDDEGEHLRRVPMDGPTTTVRLPAHASRVAIDPRYDLFRKLYREEIPPTLSQGLGADSTLVLIGSDVEPALGDALRQMAAEWAKNQNMRVVEEAEVSEAEFAGRSVFVLGAGPWQRRVLDAARVFGEEPAELVREAVDRGQSVIYCARDPRDPERAWTVVLPATPSDTPALGRKIPHYSRYSWLVFEGEANVGKGQWTVHASPLHADLSQEGR